MTEPSPTAGRWRGVIRETAILLGISILLGFSYTFLTDRGFFAPTFTQAAIAPDQRFIPIDSVRILFQQSRALFIDSRHGREFDAGRIPGAMNLPADEFDAYVVQFESFPKSQLLVVYCDGQECNSSIAVATKLANAGFSNVRVFFGGWKEWVAAGLPTEGAGK